MGKYQARVAADRIMGDEDARAIVPACLLAARHLHRPAGRGDGPHARLGAGGRHRRQADRPRNLEGSPAPASTARNAPGTTRFVVDTGRDVLAGATFVGPEIGELLHAATIAIAGEVPLARLAHAVAPFPTRNELWLKFVEAYGL